MGLRSVGVSSSDYRAILPLMQWDGDEVPELVDKAEYTHRVTPNNS